MEQRSDLRKSWTSWIRNATVVTLTASLPVNSMAADANTPIGLDGRGVAELVFDNWKNVAKQQGKEGELDKHEHSATALCLDWRRFEVTAERNAFYFEHWWAAGMAPPPSRVRTQSSDFAKSGRKRSSRDARTSNLHLV